MDLNLKGKRALVTGGSKGIGRACADVFAAEGCEVLVAARNPGSAANAKAIDNTVPTTVGVRKSRWKPSRMKTPSPPWPTIAVTVTRPIVVTVAMRMPAMIVGNASGSSTAASRRERG